MFEGKKPRSLTLPEIRTVRAIDDPDDADVALLACAYDEYIDAVEDWFHTAPAAAALKVLQAAWDASNATEEAGFPDAAADDDVAGGRDE
jgi:hypothetical protein